MAHSLAFLGSGRLASAIIRGLITKQLFPPAAIAANSKTGTTAEKLAQATGIIAEPDLARLLGPAEVVVVAFKPQSLATSDPRIAELCAGKLVISLLAGKRLARLARSFPAARNLVRTMPNTPAAIGAGITPYCAQQPLTDTDRRTVESLLGALGQFLQLDEQHLDAVTALSAGGPAFLFEFVAALREAGIAAGLPADVARQLTYETIFGSAKLLAHTGAEPEVLRDQVVSPNGTTFAGLQVMAARQFRDTVRDTILASTRRAEELSRD
ncbi:MAG: pyrroline-5-carboxylate reductase [Candidatus Didemnitutus sp.]|nr:pyrroline-5-carboxylate reductase [Candidatus Didemnitutus sp.]